MKCPDCSSANADGVARCYRCGLVLSVEAVAIADAEQERIQATLTNVTFDKKDQAERIAPYVLPNEKLIAVWDCKGTGTGFIGITNLRLIFYDQSLVIGRRSMISIPYAQVVAVAAGDGAGFMLQGSELTLMTAAGKFTFEFRGSEKALWSYRFIMDQVLNYAYPQLRG